MPSYRYEASVRLVIEADGLDEAGQVQKRAAEVLENNVNDDRVVRVGTSIMDLRYIRPTRAGEAGL